METTEFRNLREQSGPSRHFVTVDYRSATLLI
jgi:hypothetical protein